MLRRRPKLLVGYAGSAVIVVLVIGLTSWLTDTAFRSHGSSWAVLIAATSLSSAAFGMVFGRLPSPPIRLWMVPAVTALYALAVAAQWDQRAGSVDCPEPSSCEHSFAAGALVLVLLTTAIALIVYSVSRLASRIHRCHRQS